MDRFQYDLQSAIKEKFEALGGNPEYEIVESGPDVSARQFYLSKLEDNLIAPMSEAHIAEYSDGAGKELDGKMRALRSSSAMAFNLLGNGPRDLGLNDLGAPQGTYSVEYEHQSRTLKEGTGLPAHLDAWLESAQCDGTVIACEMKMMEWLTMRPSELRDKYLHAENYYEPDAAADYFIPAAKRLLAAGFTQYDWAQMFKHTLALYNAMRDPAYIGWVSRLVLVNIVWEPEIPAESSDSSMRYAVMEDEEHLEFRKFEKLMRPIRQLFMEQRGIEFTIEYRSAADFMDMIVYPNDEIARKLERYR